MTSAGVVSDIAQLMLASSPRRMPRASDKPITRPRSRWDGGSRSARMATKIRLSMPRTISSATSVARPTHTVGCAIHSMVTSVGLGQAEHALGDEAQDHLRGNRRDAPDERLPEVALDVIFL